MSRSVASRRSLGAQSIRSMMTSLPRYSAGLSIMAPLASSRASRVSLIERSIPIRVDPNPPTPEQKVKRILDGFAKTIVRYPLPEEQQFKFCLANNELHSYISEPVEFWSRWLMLKQTILTEIKQQSARSQSPEALYAFCENEMNQYALGIGKLRETLPGLNQIHLSNKFAEFCDLFEKMRSLVPSQVNPIRTESPTLNHDLRSIAAQVDAFKKVVPKEYEAVFIAGIKDVDQRQRLILRMTGHMSSIVQRLNEFIDPKLTSLSAAKEIEVVENRLRNVVTDFPIDKRVAKPKQTDKNDKKRRIKLLERHIADQKARIEELNMQLDVVKQSQQFLAQQVKESQSSWAKERKELTDMLNKPLDQERIAKGPERLQKLTEKVAELEEELAAKDVRENVDEWKRDHKKVRNAYTQMLNDVTEMLDNIIAKRAENEVFISLMDEQGPTPYEQNNPRFFEKEDLMNQLLSKQIEKFNLNQLMIARAQARVNETEVVSSKAFSAQIKENNDILDQIEGLSAQIKKLQLRIFKRKFRNAYMRGQQRILNDLQMRVIADEPTEKEESERLKEMVDFLTSEHDLKVLQFAKSYLQGDPEATASAELGFHMRIGKQINHVGNDVRLYLLKIQARNAALTVAQKKWKNLAEIDDIIGKWETETEMLQQLKDQEERFTAGLEEALNLKTEQHETIENRYQKIEERIFRIRQMSISERIEFMRQQNESLKHNNNRMQAGLSSSSE